MAAEETEQSFTVSTWRVVLLFVAILAIDTSWEWADFWVTKRIRKRKSGKGLLHAWEQLKFEIMTLGLISLLLVVFEEYLLKICISGGNGSYDSLITADDDEKPVPSRRLLAAEASCPAGKEPLWSSDLIHKMHILIFLIAVSHVLYALVSLGITTMAMRRYHRYERRAKQGGLLPLDVGQLQREGEHQIMFGLRQCVRQFTHPIDEATFIALRRMFFEGMAVENEFDFSRFVYDYLTEEFAKFVRLEFLMWILAIVFLVFPDGSYAGIWITGIFLLLSIVAGAKLHVVAMHLARHAYALYYISPEQPSTPVSSSDEDLPANVSPRAADCAVSCEGQELAQENGTTDGVGLISAELNGPGKDAGRNMACPRVHYDEVVRISMPLASRGSAVASTFPSGGLSDTAAAQAVKRVPLAQESVLSRASSGPSVLQDHRGKSRIRHCLARLHGKEGKRYLRMVRGHSGRVKKWTEDDIRKLFWFGRPRLMLRVFQYAWFENALTFAILTFSFWQDEGDMFAGVVGIGNQGSPRSSSATIVAIVLLCVDLALLVHAAAFVLPVYALTAASVNFGTQDGLLEFAKRRGIEPRMVTFLEDTRDAHGANADTEDGGHAPLPGPNPLTTSAVTTASEPEVSLPDSRPTSSRMSPAPSLSRRSASAVVAHPRSSLARFSCPPLASQPPVATGVQRQSDAQRPSLARLSASLLQGGDAHKHEDLIYHLSASAPRRGATSDTPSVEELLKSMFQRRLRQLSSGPQPPESQAPDSTRQDGPLRLQQHSIPSTVKE